MLFGLFVMDVLGLRYIFAASAICAINGAGQMGLSRLLGKRELPSLGSD
jgi:hypothetical protein